MQGIEDYDRFCPGEERSRISDAICLGRRRARFPKCKGCQFNDDEQAKLQQVDRPVGDSQALEAEKVRRDRLDALFLASDVRGVYPDPLDAELAWRIGHATALFLRSELRGYDRSRLEKSAVVVGRDIRKSSPELAGALIEGMRAAGAPVIDVGLIDAPQLCFAVNHLTCCGGVQVTASHHPGQYNGFKICGLKGKPITVDTGLTMIGKIARNTSRHRSGQVAPLEQIDLSGPYKEFVRRFLRWGEAAAGRESPLKLVVDASNGMAGRWLPVLLGDLEGLDISRLNFEHNGEFVHDPDPLVEVNLGQLKDRVLRAKADLGVCFDGDADRCIFVDHLGQTVPADLVTALLARRALEEAPGSVVVYDLCSSRVVPEEIRKAGGIPRRERRGHGFIRKALADCKGLLGGELSGRYYFRDNWYSDSAMIALAEVLSLLVETGQSLRQLITPLRRYASTGERDVQISDQEGTIRRLAERYSDAEVDFLDGITVQYPDWWFNVRPASTEPRLRLTLEARDSTMLKAKLAELTPLLGAPARGP